MLIVFITAQAPIQETASADDGNTVIRVLAVDEADMELEIWCYLLEQYENEYAAAAIMGNADFETGLCAYRTEGDKQRNEDGTYPFSLEYTQKVDSGEISKEDFAYSGPNGGGYGLFSWTGVGRKEGLYDFAKAQGTSISDWRMQLDYAYQEITERYFDLYCTLLTADSIQEATESFGMQFEQAQNIANTLVRRAEIAEEYYFKYSICEGQSGYDKGTLLPVNHEYGYMEVTFSQDLCNPNVYVYMAELVLIETGYLYSQPGGYYGAEMTKAIMEMQEDCQKPADGILDAETWDLLYSLELDSDRIPA